MLEIGPNLLDLVRDRVGVAVIIVIVWIFFR